MPKLMIRAHYRHMSDGRTDSKYRKASLSKIFKFVYIYRIVPLSEISMSVLINLSYLWFLNSNELPQGRSFSWRKVRAANIFHEINLTAFNSRQACFAK